jgi:HlyD family secretion protein
MKQQETKQPPRQGSAKLNRSRKAWFPVLLILGAIGLVAWRLAAPASGGGSNSDIPTAEVAKGNLELTLSETGELKAKRSATITSPNDKLITYLAPEGSWVKKGDLLLSLDSSKYAIEASEGQSSVQVARSMLDKAKSDLESQRFKEEAAKKQYESLLELKQKGFAMESEVEEARLGYLELKSKTVGFQAAVDQAQSEVGRAGSALALTNHKRSTNDVYAPMDGLVVYAAVGRPEDGQKIQVGMTPFEGQPIMELPDVNSMQVITQVNEMDIERLKVGQPVQVRLDAAPDTTFQGKVARIGTLAQPKVSRTSGKRTGVKVFDIDVDIVDADPRLRPGLSATVTIHVGTFSDVTYAPVEAIFHEEGRTFAYVRRMHRVRQVPVECGGSNDKYVIIVSGLQPGEHVLLAQPS